MSNERAKKVIRLNTKFIQPPHIPQYQTNGWFAYDSNPKEIGRWQWPEDTYFQRRLKKIRAEVRGGDTNDTNILSTNSKSI